MGGSDDREDSIHVDVALLDDLMNLVGELVVCRNQLLQASAAALAEETRDSIRSLDHLTSNIQGRVMKTRMRPVETTWEELPGLARRLSRESGKQCSLTLEGGDIEMDCSVLRQLQEPFRCIIQNAVQHGIQSKSGQLTLRAERLAGQVVVEISDDGPGLDTARIRERCLERRLRSAEALGRMREAEVQQLIFEPRFSSAPDRREGGLHKVQTGIARFGGTVDVRSTRGAGTTIRLKIPLTLAIIPALIISCGRHRFAIPQSNLVELVDIGSEARKQELQRMGDARVLRRYGQIVPLIPLGSELHLDGVGEDGEYIVVVHADGRTYGLIVDAVHDTEEIVVKPLGQELSGVDHFSGATVRGDNSIALILDILDLAQLTKHDCRLTASFAPEAAKEDNRIAMLKVEVEGVGATALPLDKVLRIRDVDAAELQEHSKHLFYRDGERAIPVVDLVAGERAAEAMISLVLCQTRAGCVAIAVSDVDKVIHVPPDLTACERPFWASGMTMVDDCVTVVLDMERVA